MAVETDARRRGALVDQIADEGYGIQRVLSQHECRQFVRAVAHGPAPMEWNKGHAASSRPFYELAVHPRIIEPVIAQLGDDVILWGARIVTRPPTKVHDLHSDLESAGAPGKTLSVWIGLEHTSRDSALLVVPYSHRFGVAAREARHLLAQSSPEVDDDDLLGWAQQRDARSNVVALDLADGEAVYFDGALWHGSHNLSGTTRRALILQYAASNVPVHIPDFNSRGWPVPKLELPRPPCVVVKGTAMPDVNRIVPAPVAATAGARPQLTNQVYPLQLPIPLDAGSTFGSTHIFKGATANVSALSCHASGLVHKHSPHPPHVHDDEEILVVLAGEVDLLLPEEPDGNHRTRLVAGQLVYYPAQFRHSIETASADPAHYLMFKWHNDAPRPRSSDATLGFRVVTPPAIAGDEVGFTTKKLFEGPTGQLRRLHSHVSVLTPGAGYAPHVDAHDVAIVVLEGEIETLGQRVGKHGVVFHPAGEQHGLQNPNGVTARYLVFEFHGSQAAPQAHGLRGLLMKVKDPKRWRRRLARYADQLRWFTKR